MLPITITTGFAAGGFAALPNSMKADVIDLDTVKAEKIDPAYFFILVINFKISRFHWNMVGIDSIILD